MPLDAWIIEEIRKREERRRRQEQDRRPYAPPPVHPDDIPPPAETDKPEEERGPIEIDIGGGDDNDERDSQSYTTAISLI